MLVNSLILTELGRTALIEKATGNISNDADNDKKQSSANIHTYRLRLFRNTAVETQPKLTHFLQSEVGTQMKSRTQSLEICLQVASPLNRFTYNYSNVKNVFPPLRSSPKSSQSQDKQVEGKKLESSFRRLTPQKCHTCFFGP